VQLLNWFRNANDTYSGGVDLKLAPRTTLSYDQFFVRYKGDTTFQVAPTGLTLATSTGLPVSLGVDVLGGTTTCGKAATSTTPSTLGQEVTNGVVWQYCTGTLAQNLTEPIRTVFPTEQLRFSSRYWDKISINGRLLYSDGTTKINGFNELFNGLSSNKRQTIVTGNGPGGQYAKNKRINLSGDAGIVAEVSRYISVSDAYSYWRIGNDGNFSANTQTWTGVGGTVAGGVTTVPATSMLTPLTDSTITVTNASSTGTGFLGQKIVQNTAMVTATVNPQFKLSGGWRIRNRVINNQYANNLTWNENTGLVGAVIQPSQMLRINANYETMVSRYSSGSAVNGEATGTPALGNSNTFIRVEPDSSYRLRVRASIKPAKWVNLAITGSQYSGKNSDPMVNHQEHSRDFSFGASVMPTEQLSLDFNYAYDDVYASTYLCYIFTTNVNYPNPPAGAANTGNCVKTTANPQGATTLYQGFGLYDAPASFYSGAINYAPSRYLRLNAGTRLNSLKGTAEQLNPLMVPGALQSLYLIPYADALINISPQWAWHGNFVYDGYAEKGPQGILPSRNVHGNVLTLGVKYAF
jgi:hypothetical protein